MRILVCGGRNYSNKEKVAEILTPYFYGREDVLICGMARGADTLAYQWVKKTDSHIEEYPAQWDKYGKAAGYIRNKQMLDEGKPDVVIAFPGGKGTSMMVDIAKKAGVQVVEVPQ